MSHSAVAHERNETQPPGGGGLDETGDATRRTRLANERTYLAWWRTGLTALAVSLGAGGLVPGLTDASRWPYLGVGLGFGVLGIVFIAYGAWRQREVEAAVRRGEFPGIDTRFAMAVTAVGIAIGVATLVVMVYET
jgi:putative membrane protein